MECDNMDMLMMKHMDGILTAEEQKRLDVHMETCKKCRDDFMIYDEILAGLPDGVITAPDNFENLVMEKIKALPENRRLAGSIDTMLCVAWGIFSVLFGLGFLAVINKDAVISYISASPSLSDYTDVIVSFSGFAESAAAAFMNFITGAAEAMSGYLSSSRYVLFLIVAVLAALQYVVYRKNKAEV